MITTLRRSGLVVLCAFLLNGAFTDCFAGERHELPKSKGYYFVTLPANYDKGKKYELIVGLHGAQGKAEDFMPFLADVSSARASIVICPEAEKPEGTGFRYDVNDVGRIAEAVEDAVARYSVDPARKLLVGYSNGCGMGYCCLAKRPDLFACFGGFAHGFIPSLHSRLPGFPNPVELKAAALKVPVFYSVGTKDPNHELSKQVAAELKKLNFKYVYEEPDLGHTITPEECKKFFAFADEQLKAGPAAAKK